MLYTICDIETTGGSPKSTKITEIAIYKHDGEKVVDEFQSLVNPESEIPPFITRLTGISDEMVIGAPKFYEIAKEILEFLKDTTFVAHNVGFDYGVLRTEYRSLGYDFRMPHLCTVKTARIVIPGHESYSLGKLTRGLGIELNGRHRAGGDALATAELFTLLHKTDKNNLKTFIQHDVNPEVLHPNLNLDILDDIPNKIGIYKFFDETNQLIYIGKSKHIKTRVVQHLKNNKTQKGIEMQAEIARIEFELTGSELVSLLYESDLIKKNQPRYNRALKRNMFSHGLFHYQDQNGYINFTVSTLAKKVEIPLATFSSRAEGNKFLDNKCTSYMLCKKLAGLYKSDNSCFEYHTKNCQGACMKEEDAETYNIRAQQFIDDCNFSEDNFFIIERGRARGESCIILVENGSYIGYGYLWYRQMSGTNEEWKSIIDIQTEDRDTRSIIKTYMRKNPDLKIRTFV